MNKRELYQCLLEDLRNGGNHEITQDFCYFLDTTEREIVDADLTGYHRRNNKNWLSMRVNFSPARIATIKQVLLDRLVVIRYYHFHGH